jgi:hypothetical protein
VSVVFKAERKGVRDQDPHSFTDGAESVREENAFDCGEGDDTLSAEGAGGSFVPYKSPVRLATNTTECVDGLKETRSLPALRRKQGNVSIA